MKKHRVDRKFRIDSSIFFQHQFCPFSGKFDMQFLDLSFKGPNLKLKPHYFFISHVTVAPIPVRIEPDITKPYTHKCTRMNDSENLRNDW